MFAETAGGSVNAHEHLLIEAGTKSRWREREEQTQPVQLVALWQEQPAARGTLIPPAQHPSASPQAAGCLGPPTLEMCFHDVSFCREMRLRLLGGGCLGTGWDCCHGAHLGESQT